MSVAGVRSHRTVVEGSATMDRVGRPCGSLYRQHYRLREFKDATGTSTETKRLDV